VTRDARPAGRGIIDRVRGWLAIALAAMLAASCYGSTHSAPSSGMQQTVVASATCPKPAPTEAEEWRHQWGSGATANLLGEPHHAAADPVVRVGSSARVRGKFAYGATSKDLEDEDVSLWLRMKRCGPWIRVTTARTDSDGRASFAVPAARIRRPGAYPFQLIVHGDRSRAYGTLFVVRPGIRAAVFDIDGTLTTSDAQLAKQLVGGGDPTMRDGADELVRAHVRAGYLPIYITGRPYFLREASRDWLRRHGFPRGVLITTDRLADARPSRDRVGAFKLRSLRALQAVGVDLDRAYGNASTDVCAYTEAGIAPSRIFIVGKHAGDRCDDGPPTRAIRSFRSHLAGGAGGIVRSRRRAPRAPRGQ
jgi:hypothetical protein